ncbi:MAG TPA: peptidoglycan-binding domain-containing protein [Alphaproteobacteria bacterium]|nr:peptidoglycan-binding domain-containing protein [Alphaproteobacteria bacterium]
MRNFNILALMAVAALGLSACSSTNDDMYLGSRDDIIVNNKGMPKQTAQSDVKAKIETVKEDVAAMQNEIKQEEMQDPVTAVDVKPMQATPAVAEAKPMGTTTMASSTPPKQETATMAAPAPAGDIPPNAKPGECYAKVLIPAVTQTKTERMQVSEEQKVLNRIIPAQYRVETERVLVKEARQYWKAGQGPVTRKDEVTGEIMCLVEEPAVYKIVEKRVLVEPEKPEYRMVPAQFEEVTKTEIVQPERWEWRRILCQTNMGPNSIMRIQQALNAKGYNLVVDGRYGNATMKALADYQQKNGLAAGITYETLDSLGVQLIGA